MVPQQFELVENEQQRIRVVGCVDAIELSAIVRAADERAGPGNALGTPRSGLWRPFPPEPRQRPTP
jgi:hypothetical protein